MANKNWFKSKQDAVQRANAVHVCLSCFHNQTQNWKEEPCPACKAEGTRQHFASRIEHLRGVELARLQQFGKIRNLQFQVRFPIKVEGFEICTYVADSTYTDIETGQYVVEDTKPPKFMTDEAKLKIRLFNATNAKHGIAVTLHKRST